MEGKYSKDVRKGVYMKKIVCVLSACFLLCAGIFAEGDSYFETAKVERPIRLEAAVGLTYGVVSVSWNCCKNIVFFKF